MRVPIINNSRITNVRRVITFFVLLALLPGAAVAPPKPDPPWLWPVDGARSVTAPFRPPAHDYGPGHRGIDISAPIDAVVRAPASGVVAFRGVVVDRPLLTIDHGSGIVTTLEPVQSDLSPGTAVVTGQELGTVARGGHSPADQMHVGMRYNDVYINPMLMFGEVPRAILLPCCASTGAGAGTVGSRPASMTAFTREDGRVGRSL